MKSRMQEASRTHIVANNVRANAENKQSFGRERESAAALLARTAARLDLI